MTSATLECEPLARAVESEQADAMPLPGLAYINSLELVDLAHEALGSSPTRFHLNLAKQLLVDLLREKRLRTESEQC